MVFLRVEENVAVRNVVEQNSDDAAGELRYSYPLNVIQTARNTTLSIRAVTRDTELKRRRTR